MSYPCRCVNCIIPPYLLRKLLESSDAKIRQAALNTLLNSARLRGQRSIRGTFGGLAAAPTQGERSIFDCDTRTRLSRATLVRTETGKASADASVNRAFDGLGKTREFLAKVFGRNSLDGRGMRLDAYVHYGDAYNNAFWDGQQMVFGDGDAELFDDLTKSLDVIAHELGHGVTEHVAGLEYHNQSGALNESMSDVFGSLVKQWVLNQSAREADWLIGVDVFTPQVSVDALRSMKAPGTAYDNQLFGKDPQPGHMGGFVDMEDTEEGDWGGVHVNSGIPNRAFYLAATKIGGNAWEAPGHIWYEALKASGPRTEFQEFAGTTFMMAGQLYGAASREQKAVAAAWEEVGLRVGATAAKPVPGPIPYTPSPRARPAVREEVTLDSLSRTIETLSGEVESLAALIKSRMGPADASEPTGRRPFA